MSVSPFTALILRYVVKDDSGRVTCDEVLKDFKHWTGLEISKNQLGRDMTKMAFKSVANGPERFYKIMLI